MSIFQKTAGLIKSWTTPKWLKLLISELWTILWALLVSVGKDYIRQLETKIIEVAGDNTLSNRQKFDKVFQYGRTIGITITDSALNLLLEALFSRLKKNLVV